MREQYYEKVTVTYVPLVEYNEENQVSTVMDESRFEQLQVPPPQWNPSVMDVVELIGFLPLKEQVLMMANLLTIAGYEQKELAEAMGMSYKTYRNHMWAIRKELKARGTQQEFVH